MKRFFALLTFLLLALAIVAENYYVVKVEGSILINNKALKTGDKLSDESLIKFSKQNDKLYLLSPDKGYFLLSPKHKKNQNKEWVVIMKNAIIPQNKYYQTANRGTANHFSQFDDVYDLMGFFREKVMIIENSSFTVNPENLPLNDKNYLDFSNKNKSHKLKYSQNSNSFSISGDFNVGEFKLRYVQNGSKKDIGEFKLVIATRDQIANELAVFFKNQTPDSSTSNYYKHVIPYINEAYGNTNLETIQNIISSDLNVPLEVRN